MDDKNQKINNNTLPSPHRDAPGVPLTETPPQVAEEAQARRQVAAAPVESNMSTADAQALLAVNHLQAPHATSPQSQKKNLIYLGIIVALAIVVSLVSVFHNRSTPVHTTNSPSAPLVPNPVNKPATNGGSVSQQAQYCSNPVNAALAC